MPCPTFRPGATPQRAPVTPCDTRRPTTAPRRVRPSLATVAAGLLASTLLAGCDRPDTTDATQGPATGTASGKAQAQAPSAAGSDPSTASADHAAPTGPAGGTRPAIRLAPAFPKLRFERPVDLQAARDGSGRLLVVEQAGVIRVFDNQPDVADTEVFLDIRDRVSRRHNEEGLLGLALHPDFPRVRQVFVYYSAASPRRGVLSRFLVDENNPWRARPDSEAVLLRVDQPYGNHNGGQVAFGPDGYLYLGLGDGGSGGDPHGHGQNRRTLLGSILRLDVNIRAAGRTYGIPRDNPFAGNADGLREEIYAYGLRNPWRFSWDTKTGVMWAADVGQNRYEEVDVIARGGNYGWNRMEATHCFRPERDCDRSGLRPPAAEYDHGQGVSVTGGFVYRGPDVPALTGHYVYADFGSGRLWALPTGADGKPHGTPRMLVESGRPIASFGVDAEQSLYACAFDGQLYKVVPAD